MRNCLGNKSVALSLVTSLSTLAACASPPPAHHAESESPEQRTAALLDDRRIHYQTSQTNEYGSLVEKPADQFADDLLLVCLLSSYGDPPDGFQASGASLQGRCSDDSVLGERLSFRGSDAAGYGALCVAQYAMRLAKSVEELFLYNVEGCTSWLTCPYVLSPEPPGDGQARDRFLPPTASDAASLALIAVEYSRRAVETYTSAFSACGSDAIRAERDGHQYAETLAINLADALAVSVEAAELAGNRLHGAALAATATKKSASDARSAAWRDPYDSLLRAASAYVSIPTELFNTLGEDGRILSSGRYPVVTALPETDGDVEAERLLRQHRTDPRTETGARSLDNVAADLFASANVSLGGVSGNLTPWAFLKDHGVERADLERAATRLSQEAEVLGKAMVAFEDSGVSRVTGTTLLNVPVNPWYLYARTETSVFPSEEQAGSSYAKKGVFHAMERFSAAFSSVQSTAGLNAESLRQLRSVKEYVDQFVSGRITVSICERGCSGTSVSDGILERVLLSVDLHEAGMPLDAPSFAERYDVWLGEAGLECALTGKTPRGEPCVAEEHKFQEDVVSGEQGARWAFDLGAENGPLVAGATLNPYRSGNIAAYPRVYVTARSGSGANVVVGGAALNAPPAGGSRSFSFPVGSGIEQGLMATLAVDPLAAEQTAALCGDEGLPRNLKLGLEDELIAARGTNGANDVEESWAYYLSLAKAAAEEADLLGSELVEKGLTMDERTEQARNDLEDLCGGVVNVGDLRERVCAPPYNCDLVAFLRDQGNNDENLGQLKKCLGLDATVNAVLGSNPVCMWWMRKSSGELMEQPCTCPDRRTDPDGYDTCPGRAVDWREGLSTSLFGAVTTDPPTSACVAPVLSFSGAAPTELDCHKLFTRPRAGTPAGLTKTPGGVFYDNTKFILFNETLGLVPALRPQEKRVELPCAALASLRGKEGAEREAAWQQLQRPGTVLGFNRESLGVVARRLKVERDLLNFVTIVRDDMPWLGTGGRQSIDNPSPWVAKGTFPCAGVQGLGSSCNQNNPSLLCGADCGSGTDSHIVQRVAVGERLAKAVELLRMVTGTGVEGIKVSASPLPNLATGGGITFEPATSFDPAFAPGAELRVSSLSVSDEVLCNEPALCPKPGAEVKSVCIWNVPSWPGVDSSRLITGACPDTAARLGISISTYDFPREFIDASGYRHWPVTNAYDAAQFWSKSLARDLKAGFSRQEGPLADAVGFVGAGELKRSVPALSNYTTTDLADAFELACLATSDSYMPDACDPVASASVSSVDDLARARGVLECRARQIRKLAAGMPLVDVPASFARQLGATGAAGIYPEFGGSYAVTVNELYGALLQISSQMIGVSSHSEAAGLALDGVRAALEANKYRKREAIERAAQEIAHYEDACSIAQLDASIQVDAAFAQAAGSVISAIVSQDYGAAAGSIASAAVHAQGALALADAECGAGEVQAAHARTISALQADILETGDDQILIKAADEMRDHQENVELTWKALYDAYGDAQAALAKLATQRSQAMRAAATVLMLDNDAAGREFNVNTAMRARFNTLAVRYDRARKYAVRMAYLARRAIEQKLGFDLSRMNDDVGWVPAPRSWADKLCSLTGIDYAKIRTRDTERSESSGSDDYADEYVGDYVRRLEELMTAYVNTYVSHDGDDLAVISLRDDILGVTSQVCNVEGRNLLLQSYLASDGPALDATPSERVAWQNETPVWETACGGGSCVKVETYPVVEDGQSKVPFVAYGRNVDGTRLPARTTEENLQPGVDRVLATDPVAFGVLGNPVRSVRLRAATPAGGAPDPVHAEEGTLPSRMAYRYVASSCVSGAVGARDSVCLDQSDNPQAMPLRASAAATFSVRPVGIGGKPTLLIPPGGQVHNDGLTTRTESYTISYVLRAPRGGRGWLYADSFQDAEGRSNLARLSLNESTYWVTNFWGASDSNTRYGALESFRRFSPPLLPGVGDIVTVRSAPGRFELFVNGNRHGVSEVSLPTRLSQTLAYAIQREIEVAELVAYERSLSDDELGALHGNLASRYGIIRAQPDVSFSADLLEETRRTGARSAGYDEPGDVILNVNTGQAMNTWGGVQLDPTEPFSSDHVAFVMDLDRGVNFGQAHRVSERATYGTADRRVDQAHDEFSVTVVARAMQPHVHRLYAGDIAGTTGVGVHYSGRFALEVDSSTGRVGYHKYNMGEAPRFSAAGVVDANVPFVITLRVSRRRDRLDFFVNGELVHTELGGFSPTMSPHFGGRDGGYLRGLLAEGLVHAQDFTDQQIQQLHAALGAKYEIATSAGAAPQLPSAPSGKPEYRQSLSLPSGVYVLSWYEDGEDREPPQLVPFVRDAQGGYLETQAGGPLRYSEEMWLARGWLRHWVVFEGGGELTIGWQVPSTERGVMFAAPQLEKLDWTAASGRPGRFWPTDDDGLSPFGTCADHDGAEFRKAWKVGCETYCPRDLPSCQTGAAMPAELPSRCFRELTFQIEQDQIDSGEIGGHAGLAAGNFNYRWTELGVNAVGVGVKSCASAARPSTCYANNFVQYSLRHDGPFTVRNYLGRDYEAPIFPGRIQQAKALLAERYLSNPLSGADRTLLTDYWDRELLGRPLSGQYTLRIYDEDGNEDSLDFSKLEDLQLVIRYRYWTRLQ